MTNKYCVWVDGRWVPAFRLRRVRGSRCAECELSDGQWHLCGDGEWRRA